MEATVVMRSTGKGYTERPSIFTIGGYTFVINGEGIAFDWNDMIGNAHVDAEGRITIVSNLSYFDLECYAEGFTEIGLSVDDVTAEFLLGATDIYELTYECFEDPDEEKLIPMELVSFEIDGKTLPDSVIKIYNERESQNVA